MTAFDVDLSPQHFQFRNSSQSSRVVVEVAIFQSAGRGLCFHVAFRVDSLQVRVGKIDFCGVGSIAPTVAFGESRARSFHRIRHAPAFWFSDRRAFTAAPSIASRRLTLDRDAKVIHVSVLQEFDP
jgi:hypothetical protein